MHCHYISKYRGAAYDTCNLKYSVPKEIPVVFHNKSNYDYHFIKRNKKRVLRGKFNCLKENTEKHKTFSVPITKRAKRIGRNREETTKTWSYKLPFTDSTRYKLIKTRCWNVFENVCLIWLPYIYIYFIYMTTLNIWLPYYIYVYVYIWFLVRFSCTSTMFIVIVLLFISHEPHKHINIKLIKVKVVFVLTHGRSFLTGSN